jgi:hypothetical protein
LLEQALGGFDACQILFAFIFFVRLQISVRAPDAPDGHMRNREIELTLQSSRSNDRQPVAQSQELLFDLRRSFAWAAAKSMTVFAQSARPVLLKATRPSAHRWHARGKRLERSV